MGAKDTVALNHDSISRLEGALKAEGYTQGHLAEAIGASDSTVSNLIKGNKVRVSYIQSIEVFLGCALLNDPNRSSIEHGAYFYSDLVGLVGQYALLRRGYDNPSLVICQELEIAKEQGDQSFSFYETDHVESKLYPRKNDQRGHVYIGEETGLLHLVTVERGAVRTMSFVMQKNSFRQYGAVLTSRKTGRGHQPAVSPVVLCKEMAGRTFSYGILEPGGEWHEESIKMLDEAERSVVRFALDQQRGQSDRSPLKLLGS